MVAHVGQDLRSGLDGVDVVAVELLGLVAVRAVVRLEAGRDLFDHLAVLAHEQLELRVDHLREARAAEHHSSSR